MAAAAVALRLTMLVGLSGGVLGPGLRVAHDDGAGPGFHISGSMDGLQPGLRRPLTVGLSNAGASAIRVTSITVTVGAASPECSGDLLSIEPLDRATVVPAGGAATATVFVTLAASAPDACEGVRFPFTYGGTADRA
jgi:hypothetical protein